MNGRSLNNQAREAWAKDFLLKYNWNYHCIVLFDRKKSLDSCSTEIKNFLYKFSQKRENHVTTLFNQWFCMYFVIRGTIQNHCHLLIHIPYHKEKIIDMEKFGSAMQEYINESIEFKIRMPVAKYIETEEHRIKTCWYLVKEKNINLFNPEKVFFEAFGAQKKARFEREIFENLDSKIWIAENKETIKKYFRSIYNELILKKAEECDKVQCKPKTINDLFDQIEDFNFNEGENPWEKT